MLRIGVRQRERRAALARGLIHRSFAAFIGMMKALGVLSYEVRGSEKLHRRGLLVLANHPSLIDVVFLVSLIRHPDCVVKASLIRNPFTRGPVQTADFICNDSGAGLLEDCIASVRSGSNLVIFPEGTRTPPSGALHLQRGAANVAIRGRIDVTPVLIRCHPPTLTKGEKWYRVPPQRVHFVIEVQDDIAVQAFVDAAPSEALAARRLTDHLTHYFAKELQRAHA
ncbi:lysophospholipid acyltransferase family protein [Caldimonas mangrovi]